MKDPFTLETERKRNIRQKYIERFSKDREVGSDAPWIFPESESVHVNTDESRVRWIVYFVLILFSVLVVKTWILQINMGDQYRVWAEENRIRIQDIIAPRGIISDRYGNELVTNIPNFVLTIVPADLPVETSEKNSIFERLSKLANIPTEDITEIIDASPKYSYQHVPITDHIPHEQAVLIEIEIKELPGVHLGVTATREYINDTSYAHLIGYTGKLTQEEFNILSFENSDYNLNEVIGKSGIEFSYEDELRGINGKKEIEVDALGKEQKVIAESSPYPGNNLILTIDGELQQFTTKTLEKSLKQNSQATGGAVVILDPRNGEVLSIASAPSFSSNSFVQGLSEEQYTALLEDPKNPLFFRAIAGEYPSGSVIKPLIAAAALQEGVVTPQSTYVSTGGIEIGPWFFPDWKAGGHGQTDIRKAIAESVNTYFYYAGGGDNETFTGLGVDRIRQYGELFGLSNKLGIDIGGEKEGFLPSKEWKEEVKNDRWYIGDTYHLAIGQGDLLVTPLQIASYISVIANGGTLYRPHVNLEIRGANSELISRKDKMIIRSDFVDKKYIQVVREGMHDAVIYGSSISLSSLPFSSAGKTGTAQFGVEGKTHAWFTSFAPYENPEIVVSVIVESGGEGHAAALPIAKDILQWWGENRL
ncbi:penicillin-binding protein 2 [Patescibacteria group bacterium]